MKITIGSIRTSKKKLYEEVEYLLLDNKFILAIKAYRTGTGASLIEAKRKVECHRARLQAEGKLKVERD